jgi:WD40 repeat protein
MPNDSLQYAIQLSRGGHKSEAQRILLEIVKEDPSNEKAWVWLVDTLTKPELRLAALKRGLQENPKSVLLQKALDTMQSAIPDKKPPEEIFAKRNFSKLPITSSFSPADTAIAAETPRATFIPDPPSSREPDNLENEIKVKTKMPGWVWTAIVLLVVTITLLGMTIFWVWKNLPANDNRLSINLSNSPLSSSGSMGTVSPGNLPSTVPTSTPGLILALNPTEILSAPLEATPQPTLIAGEFPIITVDNVGNIHEVDRFANVSRILDFSRDGREMAGLSGDVLTIWDLTTFSKISSIDQYKGKVKDAAFLSEGSVLALALDGFQIVLIDFNSTEIIKTFEIDPMEVDRIFNQPELSQALPQDFNLAISPDGNLIAAGIYGLATVWDLNSASQVGSISITNAELANSYTDQASGFDPLFSPEGTQIAFVMSGILYMLDPNSGVEIYHFPTDPPAMIQFSPDGKYLLVSSNGYLDLYDALNGNRIQQFQGYLNASLRANAFAFSPDSHLLAYETIDPGEVINVIIWDLPNQELINDLPGFTDLIYSISFSPDGNLLVAAGGSNEVKVWDTATWDQAVRFESLNSLLFIPGGSFLLGSEEADVVILGVNNAIPSALLQETQTPEGKSIPGLTPEELINYLETSANGYICEGYDVYVVYGYGSCQLEPGANVMIDIEFHGDAGTIQSIIVTASSTKKDFAPLNGDEIQNALVFISWLQDLPYDGSQPDTFLNWWFENAPQVAASGGEFTEKIGGVDYEISKDDPADVINLWIGVYN